MSKGASNAKQSDDSECDDIKGLAGTATPYLFAGFREGIEGRVFTGISIQRTPDGAYKGSLRGIKNMGSRTESGLVTYVTGKSYGGVLAGLELGVSYDDLDWRKDNFYKRTEESKVNRRSNAGKVFLG